MNAFIAWVEAPRRDNYKSAHRQWRNRGETEMHKPKFDWDNENIEHFAKHQITPSEAEQVVLNRPIDLEAELRNGEERVPHIGETDAGRILIVVTTMQGKKVRVVTAWPANKNYRRYFLSMKRNGNVGRTETNDLRK
jgi:uncharacterized DUF497 family protein